MRVLLFTPTAGSLLEGMLARCFENLSVASSAGAALAACVEQTPPLVVLDAEVDQAQAETFLLACGEDVRVALIYPERAGALRHHPAVRYSLLAPAPWKEIGDFVVRCSRSAARAVAARAYYQRRRMVPRVESPDVELGMKTSAA